MLKVLKPKLWQILQNARAKQVAYKYMAFSSYPKLVTGLSPIIICFVLFGLTEVWDTCSLIFFGRFTSCLCLNYC